MQALPLRSLRITDAATLVVSNLARGLCATVVGREQQFAGGDRASALGQFGLAPSRAGTSLARMGVLGYLRALMPRDDWFEPAGGTPVVGSGVPPTGGLLPLALQHRLVCLWFSRAALRMRLVRGRATRWWVRFRATRWWVQSRLGGSGFEGPGVPSQWR
jgi:hypothetical protein